MQLRIPLSQRLRSEKDNLSCLYAYGSDISQPKGDGCARIAFQNSDIDIFGITEPNVAFTESFVSAVNGLVKKAFGRGHITYATMPNKKRGYHPGGILQLAQGTASARSTKHGGDKYGRYAWEEFHRKNNNKLCIITAYRVTQKKGTQPRSMDSNTVYWQQVQAMMNDGSVSPDPRNQILKDLTRFIQSKQAEGCEILLMMDANEDINAKSSKLGKFVKNNALIDIHSASRYLTT